MLTIPKWVIYDITLPRWWFLSYPQIIYPYIRCSGIFNEMHRPEAIMSMVLVYVATKLADFLRTV